MTKMEMLIVTCYSNTPSWEVSEASLYTYLYMKQPPVDFLEQVPAMTRHHHSIQNLWSSAH